MDLVHGVAEKNQWQLASGQLIEMREGRKKTERTLKDDYQNIDKQFKDQLIKTKVPRPRPSHVGILLI